MASTGPKGINWDAIPLGKVTDADAARMAGTTALSAGNARRARGIPAHGGKTRHRPDIDWSNVPLGEKPDHVIAEELGVSIGTVVLRRQSARIPAFRKQNAIDWQAESRLGVMTDADLAGVLGCSVASVARARAAKGIKPAMSARAYVSQEQSARIRAIHNKYPDLATVEIARILKCSIARVYNVLAKSGRVSREKMTDAKKKQLSDMALNKFHEDARYAAWLKTPEGIAVTEGAKKIVREGEKE